MEVIARINTDTPSGRKIVRELENKKAVKLEYPLPEAIKAEETYSVEDAFSDLRKRVNEYYSK